MKYWKDEETGIPYYQPDSTREWLEEIIGVGFDYDDRQTSDELKDLIDEIVSMSIKALRCLDDGKIENKE